MDNKNLKQEIVGSIREIIFGLEDSLVSTLGALIGIAAGAQSTYIVILSGFVLLAAESTSMAAGSYLSSKSAIEADAQLRRENGDKVVKESRHIRAAVVMGVSYVLGGLVPLSPFFFFEVNTAIMPSVVLTVFCLFLVGLWASKYTKRPRLRSGFEMAGISLAAALIGYLIGRVVADVFAAGVL